MLHQALARLVDIVDLISEVTEIAALVIGFRIPIMRKLDLVLRVPRSREIKQREPALRALHAPDFLEAELVAKKVERLVDVGNADHGVEISHASPPGVSEPRRPHP